MLRTIRQFDQALDKDLEKIEWLSPLGTIKDATGLSRTVILGLFAASMFYFATIGFGCIISNMIGFIYPAYRSYKAIQTEGKGDDTQWLTYWVVYAFFTVTDGAFGVVFAWLPLYFFIKVAFLIWCMHPKTNGATFVLQRVIAPFLARYEPHIDQAGASLVSVLKRNKHHMDTMLATGMQKGMVLAAKGSSVFEDTVARRTTGEFQQLAGATIGEEDADDPDMQPGNKSATATLAPKAHVKNGE